MSTILKFLEGLGGFVAGVAGRTGVAILAGLALVLPALLLALGWRALTGRRRRGARSGVRFAPGHTWLAERGGEGALEVGLDEIAERILPSATALELPAKGMEVHRGDPIAIVRAGRRAIRVYAPVDGTIVGVNRRARRNPALVKEDPYGAGWLFLVAPRDASWRELPAGPTAEAWVASERRRLASFVERELGVDAADGGELVAPAPSLLGEDGWRRVAESFLHGQ